MANPFFDQPILNTPYEMPSRYWELDRDGQPTQKIIPGRRIADFITPIPKPRKSKKGKESESESAIQTRMDIFGLAALVLKKASPDERQRWKLRTQVRR